MTDQSTKFGNTHVAIDATGKTTVCWVDAKERKPDRDGWFIVARPMSDGVSFRVDMDLWRGRIFGWVFGPVAHWAPQPDPPEVKDA